MLTSGDEIILIARAQMEDRKFYLAGCFPTQHIPTPRVTLQASTSYGLRLAQPRKMPVIPFNSTLAMLQASQRGDVTRAVDSHVCQTSSPTPFGLQEKKRSERHPSKNSICQIMKFGRTSDSPPPRRAPTNPAKWLEMVPEPSHPATKFPHFPVGHKNRAALRLRGTGARTVGWLQPIRE